MTEQVAVTEHGDMFHRQMPNAERVTACGAASDPVMMTRLEARRRGYAPCGRCYEGVKELGAFSLFQGGADRWTDREGVLWTCWTRKRLVLCPVCERPIPSGGVVYFCVVDQRPLHEGCKSDHQASPRGGEVHVDKRAVFVDREAKRQRWRELEREAPGCEEDGEGEGVEELVMGALRRRKVRRRVLSATG